jgi:hypothetical protein
LFILTKATTEKNIITTMPAVPRSGCEYIGKMVIKRKTNGTTMSLSVRALWVAASEKKRARISIKVNFASSEGCTLKPATLSQRWDPYFDVPKRKTETSRTRHSR